MCKTMTQFAAAAALALGVSSIAVAQPASYTGPSSLKTTTVKQLLDTGKDDQVAILQGRIVSFDGDDHYTFEDDTGRIRLEIDEDKFPVGQPISAETLVELRGEFEKEFGKTEFEVDRIVVLQ